MSSSQLRDMTNEELLETLQEAKEEKFKLRFHVATNQLDNTARISEVKREIARILTVLRERELAQDAVPAEPETAAAGKEKA